MWPVSSWGGAGSSRLFFLVFHGEERFDEHTREHLHEPPGAVTGPLVALAVPSVIIGALTVAAVVYGDFFDGVIVVEEGRDVLARLGEEFHGVLAFTLHALQTPVLWIALAGVATAALFYLVSPGIPKALDERLGWARRILDNKYGFDDFNQAVFARGSVGLGRQLWQRGDVRIIDGALVNGSANRVGALAGVARHLQSGLLYHYAFAMIIGVLVLLTWFLFVL